jgi:hypothetical protein
MGNIANHNKSESIWMVPTISELNEKWLDTESLRQDYIFKGGEYISVLRRVCMYLHVLYFTTMSVADNKKHFNQLQATESISAQLYSNQKIAS